MRHKFEGHRMTSMQFDSLIKVIAKYISSAALLVMAIGQLSLANGQTLTGLPAFDFPEADIVSPSTAQSYYSSLTQTRTADLQVGRAEAQMNALAAALNYDPELMFEYVRNSVNRHGVFGVSKGAYGAFLDHDGTAFDQVELLAYLLDQAIVNGSTVSYEVVFGEVEISGQQWIDWTGISDRSIACQSLANGSIPMVFPGASTCPTGNVVLSPASVLTIGHAWLVVDGKIWDPSYKVVERAGIMDFRSLSQLQATDISAAAKIGMIFNDFSQAVPYIQNINRAQIHSVLANKATRLLSQMQSRNHFSEPSSTSIYGKSAQDINNISRINVLSTRLLPKAPLASYLPWISGASRFPDSLRIKLDLQVQGSTGFFFGGSTTVFADQVYGRPFSLRARPHSGAANDGDCSSYETSDWVGFGFLGGFERIDYCLMLTVGQTNIATESNIGKLIHNRSVNVYVEIDHPYAAESGSYLDATSSQASPLNSVSIISDVVIANSWGRSTGRVLSEYSDYFGLDSRSPGPFSLGIDASGSAQYTTYNEGSVSSAASNYVRHKLAASWLAQKSKFTDVVSGVSGAEILNHRSFGFVFSDVSINNPVEQVWPPVFTPRTLGDQDGWSIANETVFLDLRSADSISSTSDFFAIRRTLATIGAGLESAVFAHIMGTVDTHSMPSKFDYAARLSSDPLIQKKEFSESSNWPVPFYYFADASECDDAKSIIGPESGMADILVSTVCFGLQSLSPPEPPASSTLGDPGMVIPGYANLGPSQRQSVIKYRRKDEVSGVVFPTARMQRRCKAPDANISTCQMQINPDQSCLSVDGCEQGLYSSFDTEGCLTGGAGLSESYSSSGSFLCWDENAQVWTNWGPWEYIETPKLDVFGSGINYIPIYDTHPNRGGALVAWDGTGRTSPLVTGYAGISKGGGADMTPSEIQAQSLPTSDDLLGAGNDLSEYFSIDADSGGVTVSTGPIVNIGAGPSAISFERTMKAGSRSAKEPVWTHSFDIQAGISSSGLQAFGSVRPEASSQSIIAVLAMLDLYSDTSTAPEDILVREVAAPLVMHWWQMQTLHNTISVRTGASTEQFVRLADGTFAGAPGSTSTILVTGIPYEIERKYDWYRKDTYNEAAQSFEWKFDQVSFVLTDEHENQTAFRYVEVEEVEPWEGQVRSDRTGNWGWKYFWLPEQTNLKTGGVVNYNLAATSRGVESGWVDNPQGNRLTFDEGSVSDSSGNSGSFSNTSVEFPDGERLEYEFKTTPKFGNRVVQVGEVTVPSGLQETPDTDEHIGFEFVAIDSIVQRGDGDAARVLAQISYDAANNVSRVNRYPDGEVGETAGFATSYGSGDRVISSITDESGATSRSINRSADGGTVRSVDASGRVTIRELNGLGYPTEERLIEPGANEASDWSARVQKVYDAYNNVLFEAGYSRTDGNGVVIGSEVLVTQYRYANTRWPKKVTKTIDPSGYATIFEYDENGQIVREVGPFKDEASGNEQGLPDYFEAEVPSYSDLDDPNCHAANIPCTEYVYDYASSIDPPAVVTTSFGYLVENRSKREDQSDGLSSDEVWQRVFHDYHGVEQQYLPQATRTLEHTTHPELAQ